MNHDEIIDDLGTLAGFIHDEVAERADDVDFTHAVELEDALTAVVRSASEAIGLLNATKMEQLEAGERRVGTRVFIRVKKFKDRADHPLIRQHVVDYAIAEATSRETGDIDPRAAAQVAAEAVMDLYVAPSTKVKTTKLAKRGVPEGTKVIREVDDGWGIQVVETRPGR